MLTVEFSKELFDAVSISVWVISSSKGKRVFVIAYLMRFLNFFYNKNSNLFLHFINFLFIENKSSRKKFNENYFFT